MAFLQYLKYPPVLEKIINFIPRLINLMIALLILIAVYIVITTAIRKILMVRARTEKQKENVKVFINVWRYFFFFIVILVIIFTSTGSLTALGISAGLLTAALGWALQRPITGIAGWIMVVVRKPFQVGDIIILGDKKGIVDDITLTHINIKEIGGTTGGEDKSGRIIMIPNSKLFEQDVINYTLQDEYILDEVTTTITYESNLAVAEKICKDAALKITADFIKYAQKKPFIRLAFQPSGIDVKVRYYTIAKKRQRISTEVTREIFNNIRKNRKVEIAYPHTEILYRKK